MKKTFLIIYLIISNLVVSQEYSSVQKVIDEYKNTKLLKNASWSVTARYLKSGENIISLNSELSLAPASNLKLITSVAALDILGEDHKFVTRIYSEGKIDSYGNLDGNIYIVGGGDPTLGYDRVEDSSKLNDLMSSWIEEIKSLGISSISGSIIADDLLYDRIPIPNHWVWMDLGNYYAASTSALTINNNLYSLYFKPSKIVGDIA